MDSTSLQRELFQQIKALVPNNISFVDAIADLLSISTDSAYRRIRAEKSISLEEIQKLATHFHISMDALLSIHSSSTVFYGSWLNRNPFSLQQYLNSILNMTVSISKGDQKALYYEAKDFPPLSLFPLTRAGCFQIFLLGTNHLK
ncbi:MAG: hypothetical protein JST06_07755 [Bacteroidetes bacterium]|nr:hypothetical protein [Bacteroidota bacterium]